MRKFFASGLAALVLALLMIMPASSARMEPLVSVQWLNGHLREPILFSTTLLRNLNVAVTGEPSVPRETEAMGQKLLFPASVFNYYSPFYRIVGTNVTAPVNGARIPRLRATRLCHTPIARTTSPPTQLAHAGSRATRSRSSLGTVSTH